MDHIARQVFLDDQSCFDGFPQTDIIGDEKVDPREQERLAEGFELVGVEPDAGAEPGSGL